MRLGMTNENLEIGTPSVDEIATVVGWAAAEGWNPGLGDVDLIASMIPQPLRVARIAGEVVGSVSLASWSDDACFLGFFIVRPEWRRKGIGEALWSQAMSESEGIEIGLDAVPEQVQRYARSGFQAGYRTLAMTGTLDAMPLGHGPDVREGMAADRAAIIALDTQAYGSDRGSYLSQWLADPMKQAVVIDGSSGLSAAAVARPTLAGWRIGPVYCEEVTQFVALVAAFAPHIGNSMVTLQVPETNPRAREAARLLGLRETGYDVRMKRFSAPAPPTASVFGIASLEFG
jgi:GNAT superfamily N-acetyltransferase